VPDLALIAVSTHLDQLQSQLSRLYTQGVSETTQKRVQQLCKNSGFAVLGCGRSRLALAINDRVVAKLAWRQAGLADNVVEWRFWQQANSQLQLLLASTHWHSPGGVNFQERCQPLSAEETSEYTTLRTLLAQAGITDSAVNLGRCDQRIVCYDYAMLGMEAGLALLN
jgi:sulfur carrier protein ThiS